MFAAEDLSSDTILIASRKPLTLDIGMIARAFGDPVTRAEAQRAGFDSPHDVLAYLLLGPEELESFTAGAPVNTDDNARIEFAAPRDLLGYAKFDPYLAKVYGPHVALRAAHGRRRRATTAPIAPRPWRGWRAACWPTARRARPSCGTAAPRPKRPGRAEPDVAHARLLLELVATREDRDPEIPLAPDEGLAPPVIPRQPGRRRRDARARGVPGRHRAGREEQVRQRLQDHRGLARANLGRQARQGLLAADRLPRLQGRVLRRRHRRAEAARRRRRVRQAAARGLYRMVDADEKAGGEPRRRTLAWWRDFWNRSYIAIQPGGAQPDSQPWRIGRNYQLFRYQLAVNAYGQSPTKFNGGLFTVDPEFTDPKLTYDPDYRRWGGGSFTAQNQRLVYWPMLKSGDFDMMAAQFDFYLRALRNAEIRTEVYWGHSGASFTEQMENFGLPVAYEYGWRRPGGMDRGIQDSRYVDYLWDTALEFCLMILDVERFSAADITKYLPLIESCATFFDQHYQQHLLKTEGRPLDENGRLVLYPGTACETYKETVNSAVTIAGLRTVVSRLLALPPRYLTAEKRAYFQQYLRRIPPLPFRERSGHRTIAPAALFDRIQNVEIPQLYPVFPYGIYGIGRPDLQAAIDTWRYGVENPQQKNYISWHQDAIFCARLGLTEEAAAITAKKLDDSPRRWPAFWGPGHDWVPDHNWGGSAMIGLQEMLMQTVDDKIYLFPAWPKTWDVAFRLHATYTTTVEGRLEGGKLLGLTVTPASRAGAVIVR